MSGGHLRSLVATAGVLLALGWNPIEVRPDGPLRWETSAPVVWNPDGGPLGMLDNAGATAMVQDGFAVWQAVPTATISFAVGPQIVDGSDAPVDVTADNFLEIVNLGNPQNPVIFDNEQEIWAALGISTSVIGFAGALAASGPTITKGFVALQGDWIDGVTVNPPDCGGQRCDPELNQVSQFLNIVVHEIGHFIGLGHAVVNRGVGSLAGCPAPGISVFATMLPFAHFSMETLHHDDVVGVSSLYPTAEFDTDFARISGRLFARDGAGPLDGANVVLRPDTTDCALLYGGAQATQSGVNPAETGGAGTYRFAGLDPATGYTLHVSEIDDGGSYPIGGSSPPPLGGPAEFHNGVDEDHFDPPDAPDDFELLLTGEAGSELNGRDLRVNNAGGPAAIAVSGAGSLQLTKTLGGDPLLSWGPPCNADLVPDQTYVVYAGSLSSVGGVQDHLPLVCDTGGAPSLEVTAGGGDRYYLVAPRIAGREGALATGSGGLLRTPVETCAEVRPDECP